MGFCFLDLASSYVPPDSLVKWLESGEQPVYVGFGSLNQSTLSTYWTTVLIIGCSFVVQRWYIMVALVLQLQVLRLRVLPRLFHSLETNHFGVNVCMPGV